MCRRLITKSYFTANRSSLCLGSCRWCVLRRYNSHPFLSRLLQFCLYPLFPILQCRTLLQSYLHLHLHALKSMIHTHYALHAYVYLWNMRREQLALEIPDQWRQIYMMSITLIEFQTRIWKKTPLTDFCFSHKAFPSPDCECALISD